MLKKSYPFRCLSKALPLIFLKIANNKLQFIILGSILLSISCSGCSFNQNKDFLLNNRASTLENVPSYLLKRLEQYWRFQSNSQYASSYKMEAFHTRYQIKYEDYLKFFKNASKIHSITILNVLHNDNKSNRNKFCFVLDLEFSPSNISSKGDIQRVKDFWIEQDGKWYHVIRDFFKGLY